MSDVTQIPTLDEIYQAKKDVKDINTFAISTDLAFVDSKGRGRKTVDGVIADGQADLAAAVAATGWFIVGNFSSGFTFTARNQVGRDGDGELWSYNGPFTSGSFVVAPGTTPSEPNYTNRGDAALRSALALGTADVGGATSGDVGELTTGASTDQGASFIKTKPSYLGAGSEQGDLQKISDEIVLAKMVGLGSGADDSDRLTDFLAQVGPCELIFTRGMECLINLVLLEDVERLTLTGNGAKFRIEGAVPDGGYTGLRGVGSINSLKIRGFEIYSSNTRANIITNKCAGFWTPSGVEIDGLEISDFNCHNLVNGISVNTENSGYQRNVHIFKGKISNIYGTSDTPGAGLGYGIHRADSGTDDLSSIHVHHVNIYDCERHALYQAKGKNFNYHDINIFGHRTNVSSNQFRPAINCIRSEKGSMRNITGYNIFDCFLLADKASVVCRDVEFDNLNVIGIGNAVPPYRVGSENPAALDPDSGLPVGSPESVTLRNCKAEYSGKNVDPFRFYNCEYLTVEDCKSVIDGVTATAAQFDLRASGETAGTATYSKKWIFRGNNGVIDPTASVNTRIFRLSSAFSLSAIELADEANTGEFNDVMAFTPVSITNPNITSTSLDQTGWSGATFKPVYYNGVKRRFGKRTIDTVAFTVNAGELENLDLNVNGVKKGDTVDMYMEALEGTDLILGEPQAYADNKVRLRIYNPTGGGIFVAEDTANLSWTGD